MSAKICLTSEVVWTKYYYYSSNGDVREDEGTVEWIVTVTPGSNALTAVRFGYGANARTVTHILSETWNSAGQAYSVTSARQFRYDGARQRYLDRELDPTDSVGVLDQVIFDTRSDYDGTSIYNDWTFDVQDVNLRSYEPGLATNDQLAGGGAANTLYLHTSALGSTMGTSDSSGVGSFDAAHTAFGERVMGSARRYGFAGAHGYQMQTVNGDDFMHLGARYYNPSTGRFLQRDRSGIAGGMNVYVYVRNDPLSYLDPSGLGKKWDWIKKKAKDAWNVIKKLPPYIAPNPIPAEAASDIACIYLLGAYRDHIADKHDDGLPGPKCPTCKRLDPHKKPKPKVTPNPKPTPNPKE